ncbi:MAG: hypothetical protein V9G14_09070 [Cypionkella sp.]
MQEIAELERRITAALERIGRGLEDLAESAPPVAASPEPSAEVGQVAALNEALDEERMANAQLQERLRVLRDKDANAQLVLNVRISELTRQSKSQSDEIKTLRRQVSQLSEHIATLQDAAISGVTEPHHINRAMMTELETLRAARATEAGELAEIVATLTPLIQEVQSDA